MLTGYLLVVVAPEVATFGYDAYAYWAVDPSAYRPHPDGHPRLLRLRTALAQLATLFHAVPWWVFDFLLTACCSARSRGWLAAGRLPGSCSRRC